MDDVLITSENYAEEEDDVHGIDGALSITEEQDDFFLHDWAIEIEYLEEFKEPLPSKDTSKVLTF